MDFAVRQWVRVNLVRIGQSTPGIVVPLRHGIQASRAGGEALVTGGGQGYPFSTGGLWAGAAGGPCVATYCKEPGVRCTFNNTCGSGDCGSVCCNYTCIDDDPTCTTADAPPPSVCNP
jgi:hypothetical protein